MYSSSTCIQIVYVLYVCTSTWINKAPPAKLAFLSQRRANNLFKVACAELLKRNSSVCEDNGTYCY